MAYNNFKQLNQIQQFCRGQLRLIRAKNHTPLTLCQNCCGRNNRRGGLSQVSMVTLASSFSNRVLLKLRCSWPPRGPVYRGPQFCARIVVAAQIGKCSGSREAPGNTQSLALDREKLPAIPRAALCVARSSTQYPEPRFGSRAPQSRALDREKLQAIPRASLWIARSSRQFPEPRSGSREAPGSS